MKIYFDSGGEKTAMQIIRNSIPMSEPAYLRSDGKPRYVGVEDANVLNLSPEPWGSFSSKATFHW